MDDIEHRIEFGVEGSWTDYIGYETETRHGKMAEWSKACDSSESLPAKSVSHSESCVGSNPTLVITFLPFVQNSALADIFSCRSKPLKKPSQCVLSIKNSPYQGV